MLCKSPNDSGELDFGITVTYSVFQDSGQTPCCKYLPEGLQRSLSTLSGRPGRRLPAPSTLASGSA